MLYKWIIDFTYAFPYKRRLRVTRSAVERLSASRNCVSGRNIYFLATETRGPRPKHSQRDCPSSGRKGKCKNERMEGKKGIKGKKKSPNTCRNNRVMYQGSILEALKRNI